MVSFVINRSTHSIFHTDLILSICSHVKDTWNSSGIHQASVCSATCFQVLRKHLLDKLVYPKVKRIKNKCLSSDYGMFCYRHFDTTISQVPHPTPQNLSIFILNWCMSTVGNPDH